MKFVATTIQSIHIPLRIPLQTAHGPIVSRAGFWLGLQVEGGISGWGETLPLPGFGFEPLEKSREVLEELTERLVDRDFSAPGPLLDELEPLTVAAPGARAALDLALHDLAARIDGVSLARWLARQDGRDPHKSVRVAALIGGKEPDATAHAALAAERAGFRTIKLKIGDRDFDRDLARVTAVRHALRPDMALRLDANAAWSIAEAKQRLRALEPFDIAFVEQPTAPEDHAALAELRAESNIALAADESLGDEIDADALLARHACDVLVVKPAVVGGLRSAFRIALRARASEIPVVVTSFLDSSLGRTAALHLAASLAGEIQAAGLATGSFLTHDPVSPRLPDAPELVVPVDPGLGCAPDSRTPQSGDTSDEFDHTPLEQQS